MMQAIFGVNEPIEYGQIMMNPGFLKFAEE